MNLPKKSQVEVDNNIRNIVKGIKIESPEDLVKLRTLLFSKLKILPYDESTKDFESRIRWKRTAGQILQDGFIYEGKACSDVNVAFIVLCNALGLETRFVKLSAIGREGTHSISEIKIKSQWYTFDVMKSDVIPEPGETQMGVPYGEAPYGPYLLWKKGRDLWDLNLTGISSEQEIYKKVMVADLASAC